MSLSKNRVNAKKYLAKISDNGFYIIQIYKITNMRILLLLLLLFHLKTALTAQTPAILLSPKPTEPDQRAARVLQHYLRQMTGQPVEILSSLKVPGQGALVVIGNHPNLQLMGLQRPPSMRPDAYFTGKKQCVSRRRRRRNGRRVRGV